MERVLPQSKETSRVLSAIPTSGHIVTVQIGEPVPVQDLLDDFWATHAQEYNSLSGKAGSEPAQSLSEALLNDWSRPPTAAEARLFSAITKRVQDALSSMECDVRKASGITVDHEWEAIYAAQKAALVKAQGRSSSKASTHDA